MKVLVAIIAVVLGVYVLWPESGPEPIERAAAAHTLRDTANGPVIGVEDADNSVAWLGIPYAAPPVGALRWRAPEAAANWDEPLEAIAFNNACAQLWGPLAGTEGEPGDIAGSEDCLYLNIWAPAQHSGPEGDKLPVMVWIHGGGNTIGTANTYDGSLLASGENVIVVTINYRLGYFGWMSHPALRAAADNAMDASGNFGVLDMIAALQWVQRNIGNFGGDAGNVTIFGESAGGRNVYSMLVSPLADGLFHRAISQSGLITTLPAWRGENLSDNADPGMSSSSGEWLLRQLQAAGRAGDRKQATALLASLSDADVAQFMYARTPEEILEGLEGFSGMYQAPQNFRDGTVLPAESLLSVFRSPENYNAVPFMTGTNKDEAKLFMAQDPRYVESRFGILPRIKDIDAYNRASAYVSDHWKAYAVDEVASVIANGGGAPVYAYRWDWDEGGKNWLVDFSQLIGAGHGMEVAYVFGRFDGAMTLPGFYNDDNIPGRDELSRQMRSYWSEFARTGDPGSGRENDLAQWHAWGQGDDNLMLLDTAADGGLRMVSNPMTMAQIKTRIASDPHLAGEERCAIYAEMFFKSNAGEDFWQAGEYAELGCADSDPWQAQLFR